MNSDLDQSRVLYERAILEGDQDALVQASRLLTGLEAGLALARGRIRHGEFLLERTRDPGQASENPEELPSFERAAVLYRAVGDQRGEADALFWIGCCHQVVRRAGVAANLVGLAYVAMARHRRDEAVAILDEAAVLASESHARLIQRQVDEARAQATGADC